MHVPLVFIVSALGGPLPAYLAPDPTPQEQARLLDDGPALITGAATATDASLLNPGRAGPVRTVDLNPLHTVFFAMAPERAEVLRAGRVSMQVNVARTNSMEGWKPSDGGNGLLHVETSRTEFYGRLGLGHGLEAGLSVPWIERHDPVMDGFIGWVERTSWMQRMMPSRQRYQGTPPEYELSIPGEGTVNSSANDAGAGDTTLHLKGKLTNEGTVLPATALRLGVKLPTGSWSHGFGSQTADVAVGLSFEKALLSWVTVYGTVTGTLPFAQSPYVHPFGMASLAVEGVISRALSVVVQFNTATSPYHGTEVGILDGRDDLWIVALNYRLGVAGQTVRFSLFAVENVCLFLGEPWAGSAADFTVGLNMAIEPLTRAF